MVHGNGYSYTIENKTTGLKDYYINKESHTTTEFGTAPVLSLVPGSTGEERFYVMALEDVNKGTYYCWYDAAYDSKISDYETVTPTGIGAGKTNTETMVAKWNAEAYGAKNDNGTYSDMWGVVEEGWYIPSEDEWSAFGSIFGVTLSNYENFGLRGCYWSSSLYEAFLAWSIHFDSEFADGYDLNSGSYVRLGTTF